MSDQAWETAEQLAVLSDVVRGGGQVTAQQVQEVLGRLQGGSGQVDAAGAPTATSTPQPEALPYPAPEAAASFTALLQQVPDVERLIAGGDQEAAQEAAWQLAQRYNLTADQHAREHSREQFPQAARTDEDLAKLNERVQHASLDPAGLDPADLDRLVASVNETVGNIAVDRQREHDALEQQRAAAEAKRAAQRRREQPTIDQLRKLVAQYEAGAAAPGR